ncbi:hypothetical protein ABE504_09165 [Paenibacillus oryzisoli]|uniref:COG1470 family protein n=1 Tax=Paenibacillus oryzisoli TaxID=1850517 RepID=UPI003D2C3CD9
MPTTIDLLQDWRMENREDGAAVFHYPVPEGAQGWYPIGFERAHDGSQDAMGWFGLHISLIAETEETSFRIQANFVEERSVSATVTLAGSGRHDCIVRLDDFDIERSKRNLWRFVQSFELHSAGRLVGVRLLRGERLYVETGVLGRAGEAGEDVAYTMTVHNCTDRRQHVAVKQLFEGWESLLAVVTPEKFVLEPYAQQEVKAVVRVHDLMVPGGHEMTTLRFTGNGDSSSSVEIVLKTLRKLPHPYIYHTEAKWQEVRERIDRHASFQPGYAQIIADADAWEVVPPVPVDERDYCYNTSEEHGIMSAAYAYALTKERKYAEKVAAFLRYFIDEEKGYPRKKKGCSASYVQEGHFFQHLAIPYDIIYDAGVLTQEEHQGVERTFRIYMDILDHHLQRGHISNWLLSEITGALYCALAIQDIERALRFAFGPGGSIEQLRYGLFNDGWWHECSVGYNTWVSSMYIHTAHALLPFGYNLLHTHFRIPFNDEVNSTYGGQDAEVRFGMVNKKWGGNRKNYVCIKDLFDAVIPFLDERGVLFGISDSDEKKLDGVHFGSTFDLAYQYYKDPEYIPVIRRFPQPDPIFGHAELPDYESRYTRNNAYSDNVGIAMLRSRTAERPQSEQIQAVLRYGSHGYAHGHYDRTELLSLMRYGRSFFNPEHVWWGYHHFMYKFYVQNSLTKNMVVVDGKMQVPADSRRLMFYSGQALQAAAVETVAPWAYPPYGGMIYPNTATLAERCEMNASWLPELEEAPPYGALSGYTEPVVQRRAMAVTDDYVVLFDYVKGEADHQFDCLFQMKGWRGLEADSVAHLKHTSQWSDDPLSDGQFITDCHWYDVSGASVARFETIFGEGEDQRGNRTAHNVPGPLKLDVHTAWPPQTTHITGRAAEYHGITIPLAYRVEVEGEVKAQGEFGAWLLGEGLCDIDVRGAASLSLHVQNGPNYTEQKYPVRTPQGLFWGEAYLVLTDGSTVPLRELVLDCRNVDAGHGFGKDYEGGRVTIVGNEYKDAIPTSPIDHDREAVIRLDLTGLDAVRFVGRIGADAFPGDESQRRITYAVRTQGKVGRFITIVEPHEAESMIATVQAADANTVEVRLKDGRTQIVEVSSMEQEDISLKLTEYARGQLIREETAAGK